MASENKATGTDGIDVPQENKGATSNAEAENKNSQNGDNASVDNDVRDEKIAAKPTRFQKIKAHFIRFKWWYLLALVIFLAILLPILFTVIIPAIVADILKSQKLPIYGGALYALTPAMLNMSIDTMIHSPLRVKLDPMELVLYNKNTTPEVPFLELLFPSVTLSGDTDIGIKNQTLPVLNQDELTLWFQEFFDKPKVKLSVRGKPTIHLGALKYSKGLDKTIEVPSLNYLNGFGVKSLEFNFKKNETKYNMKGILNIPNSGVLTLGLGDLQFNTMSGNISLGLINIYSLELKPGNNSVPFEGNFFFDQLVPNLREVLDSQKTPLSNGYIEFFATGNTTKVDGIQIPYLERVLNTKRIRFTIPVISLFGDVLSGILGADQGSLLDIFGEAIGNTTLLENILNRWDNGDHGNSNATQRGLIKRQKTNQSWKLNLLKFMIKGKGVTM